MATTFAEHRTSTKSWFALAVMFLAGLGGGIAALKYLPAVKERFEPNAATAAADVTAAHESPVDSPSSTSTDPTLRELRALRGELAALRAEKNPDLTANRPSREAADSRVPITKSAMADSQPSAGEATLTYWNSLNAIMIREAAMRSAPPQLTAGNAASFVSGRAGAFQFAAEAIRKLNPRGVDAEAVTIARDIAAWYDQGAANSQQAESLLGSSDIASRQGQPGQSWQAAERQHREACLEINRRGEQLQQSLSRKYGLAFPKLQ